MGGLRVQPIITSLAVVAAAAPLWAAPPRQGPIGPATASPPPPATIGPIGPAQNEGPQGQDMTSWRGFSVEGSVLLMTYDQDLHLDSGTGLRGRVYFPFYRDIDACFGFTAGSTSDRISDDTATTLDFHAGGFTRRRWDWLGDQIEAFGGATAGMFRINGGDPRDVSPMLALEGGLRWLPTNEVSAGLDYEILATRTEANRHGAGPATAFNNYFGLSFRYEF